MRDKIVRPEKVLRRKKFNPKNHPKTYEILSHLCIVTQIIV